MSDDVLRILCYAVGILVLLCIVFMTSLQIELSPPAEKSLSVERPATNPSSKQILVHLASIDNTLLGLASGLESQQSELAKSTDQLSALNMAFLTWAEEQGIIKRIPATSMPTEGSN